MPFHFDSAVPHSLRSHSGRGLTLFMASTPRSATPNAVSENGPHRSAKSGGDATTAAPVARAPSYVRRACSPSWAESCSVVPCPWCSLMASRSHQLKCDKRPVVCKHCGKDNLVAAALAAHTSSCEMAPVACPGCKEELKRRDLPAHINGPCPARGWVCPDCGQGFWIASEFVNHIIPQCDRSILACQLCGEPISAVLLARHLVTCSVREVNHLRWKNRQPQTRDRTASAPSGTAGEQRRLDSRSKYGPSRGVSPTASTRTPLSSGYGRLPADLRSRQSPSRTILDNHAIAPSPSRSTAVTKSQPPQPAAARPATDTITPWDHRSTSGGSGGVVSANHRGTLSPARTSCIVSVAARVNHTINSLRKQISSGSPASSRRPSPVSSYRQLSTAGVSAAEDGRTPSVLSRTGTPTRRLTTGDSPMRTPRVSPGPGPTRGTSPSALPVSTAVVPPPTTTTHPTSVVSHSLHVRSLLTSALRQAKRRPPDNGSATSGPPAARPATGSSSSSKIAEKPVVQRR